MTETVIVDGLMLAFVVDDGSFASAAAALAAAVVSGVVFWDLALSLSFLGDKVVKKVRRIEWGRSFIVVIYLLACLLACLFAFFRARNQGEMITRV